jgi:hypothetical protein
MQVCESQNYMVDTGIVIGKGSGKKLDDAIAAAQKDGEAQALGEVKKAAGKNKESCGNGCKPSYHLAVELTPAFGSGTLPTGNSAWAVQMAIYWTLYMDCVKKPIPPQKPKPSKPGSIYIGPMRPPVPPQTGTIYIGPVKPASPPKQGKIRIVS